jgi:hypothetical protein
MSMNTDKDSLPRLGVVSNNFKWLLAIGWVIALAAIAFVFTTQTNNKNENAQKVRTNSQTLTNPDSSVSGIAQTPISPSPSTSLSTSNRIQPVAPKVTSQDVAGMDSGVYTYVCHDLKIAPSRMQFRCRDGEDFIDEIVWNEWKATGASGKGILNQSDCSFGCKSPNYSKYPVTVKLSSPINDGTMVYFGRFDYLYVSASGREYPGVWDPTAVHDGRVISGNG